MLTCTQYIAKIKITPNNMFMPEPYVTISGTTEQLSLSASNCALSCCRAQRACNLHVFSVHYAFNCRNTIIETDGQKAKSAATDYIDRANDALNTKFAFQVVYVLRSDEISFHVNTFYSAG